MSNYSIKLTPELINPATEGSLDSSLLNGKSLQRTINMYHVENLGNRKVISGKDGEEFDDVTFQNSDGVGSFEVDAQPNPYFWQAQESEEKLEW